MTKTEAQSSSREKTPSGNVVKLPKQSQADPQKTAVDFVRDHPGLAVAGGIALGVIAAALLPRGTGRKLARGAIGLAETFGTAGLLLGRQVRETAEATGSGLREQGSAAVERLERLGETASGRIGHISEAAAARMERLIDPVENAASKVAKKAAELRSRVRG
jgi:hypothetical protein